MDPAPIVHILEEMLTRQFLEGPDRTGDPAIGVIEAPDLARLSPEAESQALAFDANVAGRQRRQAITAVVVGVFRVADANEQTVQQKNSGGHGLLVAWLVAAQIAVDLGAYPGQAARKGHEEVELLLAAAGFPAGVVAILLATAIVAPRRLQMGTGVRRYPDVGVGRGNRKGIQPFALEGVGDPSPVRPVVGESFPGPLPGDAGHVVAGIDETGLPRILDRPRSPRLNRADPPLGSNVIHSIDLPVAGWKRPIGGVVRLRPQKSGRTPAKPSSPAAEERRGRIPESDRKEKVCGPDGTRVGAIP